jgi:DUF1365 family protein
MHARFAPRVHRFAYRIFLFAIDLDELEALGRRLRLFSVGRRNLYSFRENYFLPTHEPVFNGSGTASGGPDAPRAGLKARVVAHLAGQGIDLAGGRVVLVALPRVLGYLFNPVAFYFCYDRDGTPVAALSEVTNTFKEMKPYTLGPESRALRPSSFAKATEDKDAEGEEAEVARKAVFRLRVPKHFYVSPFSDVDVAFDFTLRTPGRRLGVQIDDYVGSERVLTSTLSGARRPLTDARLLWFTLKYPFITLQVIGLIHWHAFRLWLKNVPWFGKAARAADQRDLYRPHASLASPPSDA